MDHVAFIADQIIGPTSSCSISGVNIVVFFIVWAKSATSDLYLSIVLREISHFQFRDLKYSSAYLHKKRKDCMMSFLVRFLIVFSVNFEISLRVITYRAYFRSCCTDNDMSAVAAFPYLDFALLEDFLCFYILE